MPERTQLLRLTEGDIEILTHTFHCRRLSIDHLIALTGRTAQPLKVRLSKLRAHGCLACKERPFQRYLYALGKNSVSVLAEEGVGSVETVRRRVRSRLNERSELYIPHDLMVTDIHVILQRLPKERGITLRAWEEGKPIFCRVRIKTRNKWKQYDLKPDAFCELKDGRYPDGPKTIHYFIEADRSTTKDETFQNKLRGYRAYYKSEAHKNKFGHKGFRVLTVTKTEARARSLCEAAREVIPEHESVMYLFTHLTRDFLQDPSHIFGKIFMSPQSLKEVVRKNGRKEIVDTGLRHTLIPPVKP